MAPFSFALLCAANICITWTQAGLSAAKVIRVALSASIVPTNSNHAYRKCSAASMSITETRVVAMDDPLARRPS